MSKREKALEILEELRELGDPDYLRSLPNPDYYDRWKWLIGQAQDALNTANFDNADELEDYLKEEA